MKMERPGLLYGEISETNIGYQFIPIEVGIRGKERTQILSGIEEGRQVILSLTNEQSKRKGLFGN
jgi:hypothetical protein